MTSGNETRKETRESILGNLACLIGLHNYQLSRTLDCDSGELWSNLVHIYECKRPGCYATKSRGQLPLRSLPPYSS